MIIELKGGTNVGRRGARDALGMEERQDGGKIATQGGKESINRGNYSWADGCYSQGLAQTLKEHI